MTARITTTAIALTALLQGCASRDAVGDNLFIAGIETIGPSLVTA